MVTETYGSDGSDGSDDAGVPIYRSVLETIFDSYNAALKGRGVDAEVADALTALFEQEKNPNEADIRSILEGKS